MSDEAVPLEEVHSIRFTCQVSIDGKLVELPFVASRGWGDDYQHQWDVGPASDVGCPTFDKVAGSRHRLGKVERLELAKAAAQDYALLVAKAAEAYTAERAGRAALQEALVAVSHFDVTPIPVIEP